MLVRVQVPPSAPFEKRPAEVVFFMPRNMLYSLSGASLSMTVNCELIFYLLFGYFLLKLVRC